MTFVIEILEILFVSLGVSGAGALARWFSQRARTTILVRDSNERVIVPTGMDASAREDFIRKRLEDMLLKANVVKQGPVHDSGNNTKGS